MKNLIVALIVCFTIYSCNERIVQLPETTNSEIVEVFDVSPIYIFYNDETGGAEFNRNNMIGSTNWLVNIDKRLTLAQILPHLQYLQEKRNKDSMHKNENARNYFSCSNQEIQNLAFIDFTEVEYINEHSFNYYSKISQIDTTSKIEIQFKSPSEIGLTAPNSGLLTYYSNIKKLIEDLENQYLDKKRELIVSFYDSISFQSYISLKSELLNMKNKKLEINNQEFIHN